MVGVAIEHNPLGKINKNPHFYLSINSQKKMSSENTQVEKREESKVVPVYTLTEYESAPDPSTQLFLVKGTIQGTPVAFGYYY